MTPNAQLLSTAMLPAALPCPLASAPLSFFTFPTLKHSNISALVSYSPSVLVKQPETYSGLSVVQNWKHPSSERALPAPGAAYVENELMWELQQESRMDEFEPPMGTAQDARAVGGAGI
jgi:hypothetical protein